MYFLKRNKIMQLSQFSFDVPKSLISFYPCLVRSQCRLMIINGCTGKISHKNFFDIIKEINAGDLVILNDTKVLPARFLGYRKNGGQVKFLLERILSDKKILVSIKNSKKIKIGTNIFFDQKKEIKASIVEYSNPFYKILLHDNDYSSIDIINKFGEIPLPPYIKRNVSTIDSKFYQTVYQKNIGSIAAPTAGLHFDHPLIENLQKKGIDIGYITLHIGSATFCPVKTLKIEEHVMHSELVEVSSNLINKIKSCKKKGGRIIAVGTSTLRALETVYNSFEWNSSKSFKGDTNIFIYPGYKHKLVDALVTNFHFPRSTLIMLVASFLGYKNTMNAYYEAIRKKYHFFSYGDAMYITYNHLALYK